MPKLTSRVLNEYIRYSIDFIIYFILYVIKSMDIYSKLLCITDYKTIGKYNYVHFYYSVCYSTANKD